MNGVLSLATSISTLSLILGLPKKPVITKIKRSKDRILQVFKAHHHYEDN